MADTKIMDVIGGRPASQGGSAAGAGPIDSATHRPYSTEARPALEKELKATEARHAQLATDMHNTETRLAHLRSRLAH